MNTEILQIQKVKITAYLLGKSIRLADFKAAYKGSIYFANVNEIFIKNSEYSYIYIQNYGELIFSNCEENIIQEFKELIKSHVESPIANGKEYKEDFAIHIYPDEEMVFDYNTIQVPQANADVIKIAMLNASQSVVLDYFTDLTETILTETSGFSEELELTGKMHISKSKLMKLTGKMLNTQNRIIDNLYFIDAPDAVWENEYLSKINDGLSSLFKIKTRFREVEYTLKIIEHNLRTFAQLAQNKTNTKMELIIIFLILFEVLNAVFGKYIFVF